MFVERMKKGRISCWGYDPTSHPTLGQEDTPPLEVYGSRFGKPRIESKRRAVLPRRRGAERVNDFETPA